jgi:flagellar motor switch protein FliN
MGDELVSQDEIEKLLQQSMENGSPKASPPAGGAPQPAGEAIPQDQIEAMLSGGAAKGSAGAAPASSPANAAVQDADKLLAQEDIEKLLSQAGKAAAPPPKPAPAKEKAPTGPLFPGEGEIVQDDVEFLLSQAERALASIDSGGPGDPPAGVMSFRLEEFSGASASTETATFDLIRDVELDLKIELGRTHMYLEDVLKLRKGSVVPLDKLAGDPVDIYVNGRLIARGEVLVLNDNFCVRVAELIAGTKPTG